MKTDCTPGQRGDSGENLTDRAVSEQVSHHESGICWPSCQGPSGAAAQDSKSIPQIQYGAEQQALTASVGRTNEQL